MDLRQIAETNLVVDCITRHQNKSCLKLAQLWVFQLTEILFLVEVGFFHRVMRIEFQGPTHRRMKCSGKIYWRKIKDCPQVLSVSNMTRWLSSVWRWNKSGPGAASLHLSSPSPHEPGPQDAELLCVSFSHLHVHHHGCIQAVTSAALGPKLGLALGLMQLPDSQSCFREREQGE